MWKQLDQGHIDYGSQLWHPLQSVNLQKIETFTKRIPQVKEENYWMRLCSLKMNSQQRRLERYRIIYTWKALEGIVPECGVKEKNQSESRTGRTCMIPKISNLATQRTKTLREQSFQVHGPGLFNSLPKSIRNITKCSINKFKEPLDLFLKNIPDQPLIGDLIPTPMNQSTGRHSNSLIDQIREYQSVPENQRRPGA